MHHSIDISNAISLPLAKCLTNAKVNIEELEFKDAKSRVAQKLLELEDDGVISKENGLFVLLNKEKLVEISTRATR